MHAGKVLADLKGRFIGDGCGHFCVWLLHDLHLWTLIGGMDKIVGKGEMDDGKAWIPNQSDVIRSSGTG